MLLRASLTAVALFIAGVFQYAIVLPMVRATPIDYWQFYFAGQLVTQGKVAQIYDTAAYEPLAQAVRATGQKVSIAHYFNRPAIFALLCAPLALFDYRTACSILVVLNYLLWGLLAWKLPPWLGAPRHVSLWLLCFYPFGISVGLMQDTLLITLVVVYSMVVLLPRKPALAGVLLALCSVKPHLIVLLPLLFVFERKWTALRSFVITGAVLAVASFLLVGTAGTQQWLHLLGSPTTDIYAWSMGNLRALKIQFGLGAAIAAAVVTAIAGGLMLRYGTYLDRLAALPVLALLISPHTYFQDYSLVVVLALVTSAPLTRYLILVPWIMLWPTFDIWPLTLVVLALTLARGLRLWWRHYETSQLTLVTVNWSARPE